MTRPESVELALATDADVAALVAAFEACTLPRANWTHRAHLAVAASYMKRLPFPAALDRIRTHIQAYSHCRGSGTGYHETITELFMRAVADYLTRHPETTCASALEGLAGLNMDWVRRHYSADRLDSDAAKAGWIEPDLRPLDC
ncbi:MAG: hypothetical protein U0804_25190 [Gemmataceae bacterium]